jgi:predicted amidohydrolase
MKVAIAQMTSKASPEHNFSVCEKMAKQAAKNGAEMVFWPESTDIIFDGDYPKEEERADYEGSRLKKFVDQMSGLAKEVRCVVSSSVVAP